MSENHESEVPASNNAPWFNRTERDRVSLIAAGLKSRTIQINDSLPFYTPINTGFRPEVPPEDPAYKDYALRLKDNFETLLKSYLERYEDTSELEAVFDGHRCYIFPGEYSNQPQPTSFVDIESLLFYLGQNEEEVVNFLDDLDEYQGNALIDGNHIVTAQLLANQLNKDVKVSKAISRDDGVIIGSDSVTQIFQPNPIYRPPNYNDLLSEQVGDTTFIVNKPPSNE